MSTEAIEKRLEGVPVYALNNNNTTDPKFIKKFKHNFNIFLGLLEASRKF